VGGRGVRLGAHRAPGSRSDAPARPGRRRTGPLAAAAGRARGARAAVPWGRLWPASAQPRRRARPGCLPSRRLPAACVDRAVLCRAGPPQAGAPRSWGHGAQAVRLRLTLKALKLTLTLAQAWAATARCARRVWRSWCARTSWSCCSASARAVARPPATQARRARPWSSRAQAQTLHGRASDPLWRGRASSQAAYPKTSNVFPLNRHPQMNAAVPWQQVARRLGGRPGLGMSRPCTCAWWEACLCHKRLRLGGSARARRPMGRPRQACGCCARRCWRRSRASGPATQSRSRSRAATSAARARQPRTCCGARRRARRAAPARPLLGLRLAASARVGAVSSAERRH